ncbi:uncharacterized protein EV422DRAFT_400714 [Fimicolochytrium jonesii]|uniref:uncharacterized protein n=1 Tax=Fimicolochytrium jonesii TaxID=1396493 RepID=UPI0022FE8408|nr:uncharacterized protein EV422DRAFT_400714 [Fimicolochytrium jonesii]KAI8822487.1 hypothetical protein EV422DRAFT_400714 [Fimicolochytrium jonesii]
MNTTKERLSDGIATPEDNKHLPDLRQGAVESRQGRIRGIARLYESLLFELYIRERDLENGVTNGGTDAATVERNDAGFKEFCSGYPLLSEELSRFLDGEEFVSGTQLHDPSTRNGLEDTAARHEGEPPSEDSTSGNSIPAGRRRPLPPPERMVTRGISAKKLAPNGEGGSESAPTSAHPASPTAPPVVSAPSPSTKRRNSVYQKAHPPDATPAAPPAKVQRTTPRSRETRQYNRKKKPLKPIFLAPETDTQLKGYRWYEWQLRVQAQPIGNLLPTAHKCLSTWDWQAARNESQQLSLLARVEQLKEKNLWSFRQLRPFEPPARKKTHWDSLLEEMRWMRTDFRQERKWKIALAYTIGQLVLEWHAAPDKRVVCIRRRSEQQEPSAPGVSTSMNVEGSPEAGEGHAIDTTLPSPSVSEAMDDFPEGLPPLYMAPNTIWQTYDDSNPEQQELPIYRPFGDGELYDDETQHKTVVPVSALIVERRVIKDESPWTSEDADARRGSVESTAPISSLFGKSATEPIPPPMLVPQPKSLEQNPEWTPAEDADLLASAPLYRFNWTVVSDIIHTQQLVKAPQRRNEWDCFFRYKELIASQSGSQLTTDGTGATNESWLATSLTSQATDAKITKHLMTMENIRKLSKNKDRYRPPADRKPPAKIILSTHETHYQAQAMAGIDLNGPPLPPSELSILRRNRLQAQEQGRQMYTAQARGGMLPVRGPAASVPIPYPQYRPRPVPAGNVVHGMPVAPVAGQPMQVPVAVAASQSPMQMRPANSSAGGCTHGGIASECCRAEWGTSIGGARPVLASCGVTSSATNNRWFPTTAARDVPSGHGTHATNAGCRRVVVLWPRWIAANERGSFKPESTNGRNAENADDESTTAATGTVAVTAAGTSATTAATIPSATANANAVSPRISLVSVTATGGHASPADIKFTADVTWTTASASADRATPAVSTTAVGSVSSTGGTACSDISGCAPYRCSICCLAKCSASRENGSEMIQQQRQIQLSRQHAQHAQAQALVHGQLPQQLSQQIPLQHLQQQQQQQQRQQQTAQQVLLQSHSQQAQAQHSQAPLPPAPTDRTLSMSPPAPAASMSANSSFGSPQRQGQPSPRPPAGQPSRAPSSDATSQ